MRKNVYSIFFTRTSQKQFGNLPKKVQKEIANILEELAKTPMIGKLLTGPLKSLRSKRAGKYRIVYKVEKQKLVIIVINIEHRKTVYRKK